MRLTIILILCGFIDSASAQFKSASIGIDGLTCSLCSNSIEKSLSKLDFIKDIKMDLNTNVAEIKFIEGKKVDINAISKKVYDAGYSVRSLSAIFNFDNKKINEGTEFTFEGAGYYFIQTSEKFLNGETTISFIGKKFISKKEYYKWEGIIKKHSSIKKENKDFYYVTL